MRHHVLDRALRQAEPLARDAILEQFGHVQSGVNPFVPCAAASHDQLPARKQQRGAFRIRKADGDGREARPVVEREGQQLADFFEVQARQAACDLRGGHDVVHDRQRDTTQVRLRAFQAGVLPFSHVTCMPNSTLSLIFFLFFSAVIRAETSLNPFKSEQ